MNTTIDKIKLGYSPLSKSIYLYRHGKDTDIALEKREASRDVHAVIVESMLDGMPNGAWKLHICKPKDKP